VNPKETIFDALLACLSSKLDDITRAARDAASYATDEESRAESKWDTQGIEASFLAAGQAHIARELAEEIDQLVAQRETLLEPRDSVQIGALIHCELQHGKETFFLVPTAGGNTVRCGEREVTTITPATPIGVALIGRTAPTPFNLPNGRPARLVAVE